MPATAAPDAPAATAELLDTAAVADRLGLTAPTVRALIQRGELEAINVSPDPAAKRPRYRVEPAAVGRFLKRRATAAKEAPG